MSVPSIKLCQSKPSYPGSFSVLQKRHSASGNLCKHFQKPVSLVVFYKSALDLVLYVDFLSIPCDSVIFIAIKLQKV